MKIKINNTMWKVNFAKIEEFGITSCGKLAILINAKFAKDTANLRSTIMHEVIHAYMYSYGIHTSDSDNLYLTTEQMCEFITMNIDNIIKLTNKIEDGLLK